MQINLESIKSKWYDFPTPDGGTIKLKVRYYPLCMIENTFRREKDGQMEVIWKNSERKRRYMHCFEDAEGLVDAEGKPLKLTNEVKEAIFDYDHVLNTGIPAFVLEKGEALTDLKGQEEKN